MTSPFIEDTGVMIFGTRGTQYSNNQFCHESFECPLGDEISYLINELDVEGHQHCWYDVVELNFPSQPALHICEGNSPGLNSWINTGRNYVEMIFTSDDHGVDNTSLLFVWRLNP